MIIFNMFFQVIMPEYLLKNNYR